MWKILKSDTIEKFSHYAKVAFKCFGDDNQITDMVDDHELPLAVLYFPVSVSFDATLLYFTAQIEQCNFFHSEKTTLSPNAVFCLSVFFSGACLDSSSLVQAIDVFCPA